MDLEYKQSLKLMLIQCQDVLTKLLASENFQAEAKKLLDSWQGVFLENSQLLRLSPLIENIKSEQDVWNLIVPIERELGVEKLETEYLISTTDKNTKTKASSTIFVLENMRSAFNVGSIFRSSEAFNIQSIYCCGYTPTPLNAKVKKTTMGTEDHIDWKHYVTLDLAIKELKRNNYKIVGAETAAGAQSLLNMNFNPKYKYAFVFGNERFGLSEAAVSACDQIIEIPLSGKKNSLNVGVAAGIFLYEVTQ